MLLYEKRKYVAFNSEQTDRYFLLCGQNHRVRLRFASFRKVESDTFCSTVVLN